MSRFGTEVRYYYRVTNPKAIAAFKAEAKGREELKGASDEFANRYGGKPMWRERGDRTLFAGLILNGYANREDRDLWTKPDKTGRISRPKKRAPKDLSEDALLRHQQIRKEYDELVELQVPKGSYLLEVGFERGHQLFLGHGYVVDLDHEPEMFCIAICAKPEAGAEGIEEILPSKYEEVIESIRENDR